MNQTSFFQSLESRTLYSGSLPGGTDPGAVAPSKPAIEMEHQVPPGSGATVDTSNGTGSGPSSGSLSADARRRFASQIIQLT